MAYDLDSDNGRNGDAWMQDIQPLAASVPPPGRQLRVQEAPDTKTTNCLRTSPIFFFLIKGNIGVVILYSFWVLSKY